MVPSQYVPKLTHHKATGKGVVRLNGRDFYVGPFGTPAAQSEYDRIIAEWLARGRQPLAPAAESKLPVSVNEVLLAFWRHAEIHYRDADGKPTSELRDYRYTLRPVKRLYGAQPAEHFGPLALKAVRQSMIQAGLCRSVVNQRIGRIKRVFKWAASEQIVPVAVYQALATVAGLARGRSEARESAPVQPVDAGHVAAAMPHLSRPVRTMIELMQLMGCRPGEVCQLRPASIEFSEPIWLFRPAKHKTAWRGKSRPIPIGPRAQAKLVAFLVGSNPPPSGFTHFDLTNQTARLAVASAYEAAGRQRDAGLLRDFSRPVVFVGGCVVDLTEAFFRPVDGRAEWFAAIRAARKSKVQPSQLCRRKANPRRRPGAVYTSRALAKAVATACERAGIPHWHPNQIRHSFATEVRAVHGLEAAQVLLGHSKADVTQVYAERDLALALKVAAEVG